jgi:hypothetical protein
MVDDGFRVEHDPVPGLEQPEAEVIVLGRRERRPRAESDVESPDLGVGRSWESHVERCQRILVDAALVFDAFRSGMEDGAKPPSISASVAST